MAGRCCDYQLRVPRSNVPVVLAMNQEHGNRRVSRRVQWTGLQKIDSITDVRIYNCRPDCGATQCASEPRTEVQRAGNALKAHLARG
jgi:hypothetical protein